MHVGIDLTALLPQPTGVDNYSQHLVTHLSRLANGDRFTLFVNAEDRGRLKRRLPDGFTVIPCALRARPARLAFQQAVLPAATVALGLDVVHSLAFVTPLARGRSKHLLTVYDMTFFTMPKAHIPLRRSAAFKTAVRLSIRRADRISVPSQATAKELLELVPSVAPERIEVVRPGIAAAFRPPTANEVRRVRKRLGLARDYILHVGTLQPRKNILGLLESYRRLVVASQAPEQLVLAGQPGWGLEPITAKLADPNLRGRVRVLGYVAQADLPPLYGGARVFVFPSLAEGFGFPPLEAMSCGAPVIASRTPALRENLEGAAELVPPSDVDALAAAIHRLSRDEDLRRRRRDQGLQHARRFRWEETARQTLVSYHELAASRPAGSPRTAEAAAGGSAGGG